jgi:signal transduction histidine kinase/CHASE2 domain-containing sensor protein
MQRFAPFRLAPRVWQGLLLGLLCALVMRGVLALGWFENFDRVALDTLFRLRGLRNPHPAIVLVVADDATVATADRWPLPRHLYAQIIDRLHQSGAKTIGLDVLLSTPSFHRTDDHQLVVASRDAGRVVQAMAFFVPTAPQVAVPNSGSESSLLPQRFSATDRNGRCRSAPWVSAPLTVLQEAAPLLGHINVYPERDGALRRIPHLIRYRGGIYPSLAMACATHFLGKTPRDIVALPDKVLLAGREIPIDAEAETWINWSGGNGTFPTFSFEDVLSGRVDPEVFKDRVVLIGTTAAGSFEHRPTPFSPLQPAIEMQASALNDILLDRPLLMPQNWVQEALLLLFCILAGVLVAPRRALAGTFVLLALSAVLWIAALLLFAVYDYYLPVGAPVFSGLLTFAVMAVWNYRRAWEESWRADSAVATLARGGALLASGRDRESLQQVILDTARDALHAQQVLWIAPDESNSLRRELFDTIFAGGQAIVWPAGEGTTSTSTDPHPGSVMQRVHLVHRNSKPRSRGGEDAGAPTTASELSDQLEALCRQLENEAPHGRKVLAHSVVAAPLSRTQSTFRDDDSTADLSRGVLVAVGREDGGWFVPRDAILLETLAEQAALALENLEYYEQLSGRVEIANRKLREAYEIVFEQSVQLSAAVESIDDALIVTNERGNAVYINASARTILREATPEVGDSVPEVLYQNNLSELAVLFDVLPSVARRTLIMDSSRLEEQVVKVRREVTWQATPSSNSPDEPPEISTAIWSAQFVPLLGEHGRMLGALLVVADVTAQRELDKMKTDFVGYVAHELRTPLTTILGYASLLQGASDKIPDEQKGVMMGSIIQHCKRLNRMISELLDVSRLEAGNVLALRYEPLDIAGMAERVLEEHRAATSRPDLHWDFRTVQRPLLAQLDSDRMEQVLNNLLSNASKYSPDGGTVTVEVEQDEEDVFLRVRDTGMGMTPEQQANLFQKFYRTRDAQLRGIKGTGLGLFLVKQLVEAHNGRIDVESAAGQGTTFTLTLPKITAPSADEFPPRRQMVAFR